MKTYTKSLCEQFTMQIVTSRDLDHALLGMSSHGARAKAQAGSHDPTSLRIGDGARAHSSARRIVRFGR